MAVDRIEELRRVAVLYARREGLDEAKVASLILPGRPPPLAKGPRSEFDDAVRSIAETMRTTLAFVVKHRGLFLHPERATNRERDGIEGEVGLVVKGAKDGLDALQERIAEFSRQRGREAPSPHAVAHLQGVVLILSERLQQLTRLFDRCRAACFREALAPWEHANRLRAEVAKSSGGRAAPQLQAQMMGNSLVLELEGLVDQVRETEGRILEISTLNHLFSTQVVQQAQKIEQLYQEALHATVHMQRGNAELVKAHGYNSSGRKWFVLLMLMASLVLLVLDYITP